MLIPFSAERRGYSNLDWLQSYHTFSFAEFYDPERMGVSVLRVINDDTVAGGGGFGTHPHRDMEIITYMVNGVIEHRDSMGNTEQITAGEVQRMTAGSGVTHSEYNASGEKPLRLLQIWIKPAQNNLPPSYEQKLIAPQVGLTWIARGDSNTDGVHIHQDAHIARISGAGEHVLPLGKDRIGFIQVVHGSAQMNGATQQVGDAVAMVDEENPVLTLADNAEVLFFDLPPVQRKAA
ncbi:MAG: quercetin 2,3-dioxygenase [Verrucomicrobiaceae bacterium]|nr:quercetin 2,3-dioxygenase [Verrucomicrobiaceae bacterium]